MTVESLIAILLLQLLAMAVGQPPPGAINGLGWVSVDDYDDVGDDEGDSVAQLS